MMLWGAVTAASASALESMPIAMKAAIASASKAHNRPRAASASSDDELVPPADGSAKPGPARNARAKGERENKRRNLRERVGQRKGTQGDAEPPDREPLRTRPTSHPGRDMGRARSDKLSNVRPRTCRTRRPCPATSHVAR